MASETPSIMTHYPSNGDYRGGVGDGQCLSDPSPDVLPRGFLSDEALGLSSSEVGAVCSFSSKLHLYEISFSYLAHVWRENL